MGPMLCHQKICLDTIWKEWPAVFFSSNISRLFLELVKSCQVQTLVFPALHLIKKLSISVNGFAVFHSLHLSGLLSIPPPNFSLECHGEDDACLDQGDHCHPPVWYSSNDGWLWSVSRCRKCLLETFSTHWKLLKAISATENFERLTSNNFNRNWCGRTFWLKEEKTPFSPWSNLLKKWKLPLCERGGQRSVNEIYFSSSSPSAKALNGSFLSSANQITLFNWSWLTVVTGFCAHLYRKNWQNLKKWHMLPTDLF